MTEPGQTDALKRAATRGVAWTGLESVLRQIIQIIGQLALARMLAPSDFGILGMALVFQGVAQLLADFGIGAAIVQRPAIDRLTLSSAFWANLAVACTLTALLSVGAPYIGGFYGSAEVVPVLQVLALTLLLGGLRTLPRSLLFREMAFDVLARTGIAASLIATVVAISMAAAGFGLWSLVAQPVVGNVVELILLMTAQRWRPHFEFRWAAIRELVRFSYGVLGTSLLNYASRNADNLLIGRFLGSGPLGYYALAYQIMLYPLAQVSAVIVKVLFPTLSRLQDDPARARSAFLTAVSAIALVTFPMMMGLLAVSHDFIVVVFGAKWLPMESVLQIFCLVGLLQSIGTTVGTIYLSTGNTKLMLKVSMFSTPFVLASFVAGLPWGIEGVAFAYAIATGILFCILVRIAIHLIELRAWELLRALRGTIGATVAMFLAVSFSGAYLTDFTPALRLCANVIIGIIIYVGASLWLNKRQTTDIVNLVRSQLLRPATS